MHEDGLFFTGTPHVPEPEPEAPRGTEIHLMDADERRILERRPWRMGPHARPRTSIETDAGYFTVSRYDAEQDAWVYRARFTAPKNENRTGG